MERVAVAGLSLHHTDPDGLGRVKRGLTALEAPAVRALADHLGASEAVLLSTCNRVELVFARENGHAPAREDLAALGDLLGLTGSDPLRSRLVLHTHRGAARHLLRVAASLDSLVLGEDQILTQVRAAAAEARELGLVGSILGPLFEQALRLGKRVRTATDLARHPVSVVSLGVAFLAERVSALATPRIVVIGAGATGAHAARALCAAGLVPRFVVNRGAERARSLAEEVGARVLALAGLRSGAEPLDAIVSATSSPEPILSAADLARLASRLPAGRRLVAVDLALPRDLEPCDDPRVECIDLESLRGRAAENRERRAAAAAEAELLVEDGLARLTGERAADAAAGPWAALVAETREVFELELRHLSDGRLAHLDERDRAAVERWARSTFGRLAHVPFRALRQSARNAPLDGAGPGEGWEGLE